MRVPPMLPVAVAGLIGLVLAGGGSVLAQVPRSDAPVAPAGAPSTSSSANVADAPQPLGTLLERARGALARGQMAAILPVLEAQTRWYAGEPEFDYLLGLANLDAGKPGVAILAFERVLATEPGHLQARAELGRAYLAAQETENARRQFQAVASQSIPAEARRIIDAYLAGIDRAQASTRAQTSAFVEFALGWDSNVNLGSASSQWLLAGGISVVPERVSRPSASVQSTVNGGFSWLVPINGIWQWMGGAQVSHRSNPAAHTLDTSSLDLNSGLGLRNGCHSATMLAQYQHLRLEQARFRDARGALAQWRCDVSTRMQLGLYAQAADFHFADQSVRDARRRLAGATFAYALPLPFEPVLVGNLYAGHEVPRQELAQLKYRFHGARAALNFATGASWRWSVGASWESRQYAGIEPLFDQIRHDRQIEFSLSAERGLDRHWSLVPQVSTLRNHSTLAPNDFRRSQAQLAVRYRH